MRTDGHEKLIAFRSFAKALKNSTFCSHAILTCFLKTKQKTKTKQRLLRHTALTDWFLQPRRCVLTARYGLNQVIRINLSL